VAVAAPPGGRHVGPGLLQRQPGEDQQVDDHRPDLGAHHLAGQAGGRVDRGTALAEPLQAGPGRHGLVALVQLAGDVGAGA
jgi:hypothetical protein